MKTGAAPSSTLVSLMRALDAKQLDLSLLTNEDEAVLTQVDQKLYAPLGLRFLSTILQIATFIGAYVLVNPRSDQSIVDPQFLPIAIPVWVALALCALLVFLKKKSFDGLRGAQFVESNQLTEVPTGTFFAGDLVDGYGTVTAYHPTSDPTSPLAAVTFGDITGWWDPDTKVPRDGHGLLTTQGFVHIGIPQLSGSSVYFSPRRVPASGDVPGMSDDAFGALKSLSESYAVCVGEGGILVTLAGGTNNSFEESLMDGIDNPKSWRLCYRLISGPLATFAGGLKS